MPENTAALEADLAAACGLWSEAVSAQSLLDSGSDDGWLHESAVEAEELAARRMTAAEARLQAAQSEPTVSSHLRRRW